jgi:O-antigen ligase/polysaccharide polymerase Wzy-like membrane protein
MSGSAIQPYHATPGYGISAEARSQAATWLSRWLPSALAAAAVGLVPLWIHWDLIESSRSGIIAVFDEVGVYASDVCLGLLALMAVARPVALDSRSRWLVGGLTLLAAAAALSSLSAQNSRLAAGVVGHIALLTLAWLGVRSMGASRSAIVAVLVASAMLQSVLAAAQFALQQPLVPCALHLPWLPSDVSHGGTPVILDPQGTRLLRGFGTFPHPNVLGGYLAIALVSLPLLGQRWPRWSAAWWLAGLVIGIGLGASFSRAAWLASLAGLSLAWWRTTAAQSFRRRWLPPLVGLGAVAAIMLSPAGSLVAQRLLVFSPEVNALERGSVENRLALDRSALDLIISHQPAGVGAGNYGITSVAEGYQEGWGEPAPNLALLIVAELGFAGILALVCIANATVRLLHVPSHPQYLVGSVFLAFVVLAMLDHYLWTMPLGRVIAWIPFAWLAAPPPGHAPDDRARDTPRSVPRTASSESVAQD